MKKDYSKRHNDGTLKIVAVELLDIEGENLSEQDKKTALSMFKVLEAGKCYSLYEGYTFNKDNIVYDCAKAAPTNLYTYDFPKDNELEINICSIVGGNGSGKSSLIELIMRILNNLSAMVIGEYYCNPKAEHLHYINHLYAKLFIHIGNCVFEIIVKGLKIYVNYYAYDSNKNAFIKSELKHFIPYEEFSTNHGSHKVKTNFEIKDFTQPHKGEVDIEKSLLAHICYTVVTNYSLFSFNTLDYDREYNSIKKEDLIRGKGFKDNYDVYLMKDLKREVDKNEARCWLKGIFHKNDGYQTPIVINPMRVLGNIDVNRENELSEERLMALVFKKDLNGKHFFKEIRGGLKIEAIKIKIDKTKGTSNFAGDENIELGDLDDSVFKQLCKSIIDNVYHIAEINKNLKINHRDVAENYIAYKILKIINNYTSFHSTHLYFSKLKVFDDSENEKVKMFLEKLLEDHTHITAKLWQVISYLKYGYIGKKSVVKIEVYSKNVIDLHLLKYTHEKYHAQRAEELLPPPIFKIDFNLYNKKRNLIPFHTLSSGQKQITYTISSFLYHLINLDSVFKQPKSDTDYKVKERIAYKYVNAIFDEIELYFHPEMQRCFIEDMLNGLKQMKLENIKGIQIMFATHSPFILSDIPKTNILFLDKEETETVAKEANREDMKTFGANIHAMLKSSFFLKNGTIGSYTEKIIREIVTKINLYKAWERKDYLEMNRITSQNKFLSRDKKMLSKFNENTTDETIDSIINWKFIISMLNLIEEPVFLSMLIKYIPKKYKEYVDVNPQ
ncbi:hypothetical protein EZS27_021633 [termite gut metagenome]|uniref:Endonuclease GajA/Old nuclease/RecF-like AAA domain-containing protein n=1 Tax=termite gut metagenome TaxID=433724 RepID=A0A5J4R7C7_9ZZZZ